MGDASRVEYAEDNLRRMSGGDQGTFVAAGEQFSRDSQTKLGKLKSAAQSWLNVENHDAATPERKLVRVVVDVKYDVN